MMDLSQIDVAEDSKYAFLLGSALRNEDPEQLLVVYDNLIPDGVSESRLVQIKEDARYISELSEPEFSKLVLNARNYSLALGHSSMNQTSQQSSVPPPDADSEDHVNISLKRDRQAKNHIVNTSVSPSLCNSVLPSLVHKTHPEPCDSNSVKLDLDLLGASADGDSGLPDSFYRVSGSFKNSVGCSDSTYGDSEEERPGSFDYMPPQSHVRITHSFNPPYDEEIKVDSGTEDSSSVDSPRSETSVTHYEYNLAEEGTEMSVLAYKETPQLYSQEQHHSSDCWDCFQDRRRRSEDEHLAGEDDEQDHLLSSRNVYSSVSSFQRTDTVQANEDISYGIKQLSGSGHPNRLQTIGSPNQFTDRYRTDEIKDRKATRGTDDSDKPEVSGLVDVNGNPRSVDTANNSQMHQLPRGKSENTSSSGNLASYSPAAIPQSFNSSSATDPNNLDRKKERKRLKLERRRWTPAEAYEDHKEFHDIKEILDFVEGPHSISKSEGKPVKKKQERSKKKDHHLNGPVTLEDTAGGEDGADLMETVVVTLKPGLEAMGNSSGKSLGENNISKTEPAEDNFDKNSEFHDCLTTFPTELVISDKVQQSDKSANIIKASTSALADKSDLFFEALNNIDTNLTDNDKIAHKKSTKAKEKKDRHEGGNNIGPLSPKSNMVKPKESLHMKDSLLKSVSQNNKKSYHNSNDAELPAELKSEDSFTEVKKRKKRIGGKDFSTASNNHSSSLSYHSHNSNGHSHRNNPRPHPATPPAAVGVAVVVNSGNSLPVSDQTHSSRDLSPSAFPVLTGHGPERLHADNRRNSCGDLNTESSADNKIYDSDRESAKSLPDARGIRTGGDESPVYPVSYARIAAAPRRNDNTNSPSSESGVTSGSQNSSINSSVTHTPGSTIDISPRSPPSTAVMPERKATMWKGSPRERRHSIGSSPEDKEERGKTSVAQRNRQCGSQEVLSREALKTASSDAATDPSSLPITASHSSGSSNSLQLDTDLQEGTAQSVVKLISNQPKNHVHSTQAVTKIPSQKLSKPVSLEYATSNSVNCHSQGDPITVPTQTNKLTATSVCTKIKDMLIEPSASNVTSPEPCKTKKTISAQPVTAAALPVLVIPAGDSNVKSVTSKQKVVSTPRVTQKINGSNNTKSVIFLDKRFGASSPQNLGITFGFDLSYETACEPASQSTRQHQPLLPSQPRSVASSSSSSHGTSVSSSVQSCFPTIHSHIPPAPGTAPPPSELPLISSSQSSDPVPKVPHIQGLRNGLILPSSPAGNTMQEQSVNTSISLNKDNNSTNLPSSNRTSPSPVNPGAQVTISSPITTDPVVVSGLSNPSPAAAQVNSSLAQVNKSIPHLNSVVNTPTNPAGVMFSPNYPPPPLPPGVVIVTGDVSNTNNSTSALPLIQDRQESSPENLSVSGPTEATNSGPATSPAPASKVGEAVDTMVIPPASTLSATSEAASEKQHCLPVPTEVLHIVYGEKIKPGTGCGRLVFVPQNIFQQNKGNVELASFLRKKWLDVTLKKGPCACVTLNDD